PRRGQGQGRRLDLSLGLRQLHRAEIRRELAGPPMFARLCRIAALAGLLLGAAAAARADEFATIVAGFAGGGFAAKEQAIVALGRLGDPRAVPVLQALGDDRLRAAPDGRIVIVDTAGGTTRYADAATGQDIAGLDPDSLDRIIVNNRLRGDIEAAIGALTLFSTDRGQRAEAPLGRHRQAARTRPRRRAGRGGARGRAARAGRRAPVRRHERRAARGD